MFSIKLDVRVFAQLEFNHVVEKVDGQPQPKPPSLDISLWDGTRAIVSLPEVSVILSGVYLSLDIARGRVLCYVVRLISF